MLCCCKQCDIQPFWNYFSENFAMGKDLYQGPYIEETLQCASCPYSSLLLQGISFLLEKNTFEIQNTWEETATKVDSKMLSCNFCPRFHKLISCNISSVISLSLVKRADVCCNSSAKRQFLIAACVLSFEGLRFCAHINLNECLRVLVKTPLADCLPSVLCGSCIAAPSAASADTSWLIGSTKKGEIVKRQRWSAWCVTTSVRAAKYSHGYCR